MFKAWQIFVFTAIPLALVLAGVILGSIHGSDSEREVFPTPPPRSQIEVPVGAIEYVSLSADAKTYATDGFVDCLPDESHRPSVVTSAAPDESPDS